MSYQALKAFAYEGQKYHYGDSLESLPAGCIASLLSVGRAGEIKEEIKETKTTTKKKGAK
jgi:hypothetical protein